MITIGGVVVDAAISESHRLASELSDYPSESGSQLTDNIRVMPFGLSITGVVSDSPIGAMVSQRAKEVAGDLTVSQYNYAKLEKLFADRQPITVTTSLRKYENMVLTSLDITRDAASGYALSFSCELRQIILVTNERTVVRTLKPGNGRKVNKGFKQKGNARMLVTEDNVTVYDLGPTKDPRLVLADGTRYDKEFEDTGKFKKDAKGNLIAEPVIFKKNQIIRLDQTVEPKPMRPPWAQEAK